MDLFTFFSFEIEVAQGKLASRDPFHQGNGVGRLETLTGLVKEKGVTDMINEATKLELIERLENIGQRYQMLRVNTDAIIRALRN